MDSVLNLLVAPDWGEIENVRKRLVTFLAPHDFAAAASDALAMVTSELMENAVKYGFYGGPVTQIAVTVTVDQRSVIIEVKSPLHANEDEAMDRLDHTIQWIRGYQDPFQAYLTTLKDVSAQSMDSSESGLGLVRIAYEGQSVLDFYVDDRNVLAINAVYTRDAVPSSGRGS